MIELSASGMGPAARLQRLRTATVGVAAGDRQGLITRVFGPQ
jgi:hypothetical protein